MIDLKDIISISGKPGLFRVLKNARKGVIVESLEDQKRMPVHAAHKISALEDISIYTKNEDMVLGEAMHRIYEHEDGKPTISHKKYNGELMDHAREILPELDENRVYPSDVKKLFQWYNILHAADALKIKENEEGDEDAGNDGEQPEEEAAKTDHASKDASGHEGSEEVEGASRTDSSTGDENAS